MLQTRSQEERNYILTEKISEILMRNEITQNQNGKIKCNRVIQKKNDLKSHFLQKFCNKVNTILYLLYLYYDYIFTSLYIYFLLIYFSSVT